MSCTLIWASVNWRLSNWCVKWLQTRLALSWKITTTAPSFRSQWNHDIPRWSILWGTLIVKDVLEKHGSVISHRDLLCKSLVMGPEGAENMVPHPDANGFTTVRGLVFCSTGYLDGDLENLGECPESVHCHPIRKSDIFSQINRLCPASIFFHADNFNSLTVLFPKLFGWLETSTPTFTLSYHCLRSYRYAIQAAERWRKRRRNTVESRGRPHINRIIPDLLLDNTGLESSAHRRYRPQRCPH